MGIFNVFSEYTKLTSVILGTPANFHEGEKINQAMEKYYDSKNSPQKFYLQKEYDEISIILRQNGVKVFLPNPSKEAPQQLAPRDIGFVIGNTFVVSNMRRESRKKEINSIMNLLKQGSNKVIRVPDGVFLEGGNIVIDNRTIFVGIGLRTSPNAIEFLTQNFGNDFKICPIFLNETEEIIHLDAVFNIIGDGYAIIYPKGLKNMPDQIGNYKLIKISKAEKDHGACNLLSISKSKLIIRSELKKLQSVLTKAGFTCFPVNWSETLKTGTVGPRCATLPLTRV